MLTPVKIKVAVAPAAEYENRRPLFDMLSAALPVRFAAHDASLAGLRGLVAVTDDRELRSAALENGVPCYQVYQGGAVDSSSQNRIRFESCSSVPSAFRSAELSDDSIVKFYPVGRPAEVMAQVNGQAVWSREQNGKCECHYVGLDLPVFATGDFFHAHFRGARWFALLPLLTFLAELLGSNWRKPEPRAVFIIDDPNLHHRSYGYIDFAKLARHAEANNYHATIATVPLDAWYFNREVAELFRANSHRLSMMMHGVNHVADELARPYSEAQALALLAEGLRRIGKLESRAGVKVDRIMAAPHGAFAESIADPMLRLGYEAGCVSVGSLVRWNANKRWPTDLGFPMTQALGEQAFPVFHRVGTNEIDLRLSAFLGHPVIIATHHQDYVGNLSRIEKLAKILNDIAPMRWMSIEKISRTNYVADVSEEALRIKPYTRRLTVPVEATTTTVQLEASALWPATTLDVKNRSAVRTVSDDHSGRVSTSWKNHDLEIGFSPTDPIDYRAVSPMPLGLWPVARRLLAEGRDRVKPILRMAAG